MSGRSVSNLKELKSLRDGERVSFRAQVLRVWEVGSLRMCLVGDESALTRVELGDVAVEASESYEFRGALVREYPGGWHSVVLAEGSEVVPLDDDVAVSQDKAYIERTFKILAGVQRKKGRAAGRLPPWRHPARSREGDG